MIHGGKDSETANVKCEDDLFHISRSAHSLLLIFTAQMTYQQAFYDLKNGLQQLYDAQEAAAIAHEVLYQVIRLDKLERLMKKDELLTGAQEQQFENIQAQLLAGRPMQYALQTAWFMGHAFYVDEHVLIPRPETEELVQWIIDDMPENAATVLDIGTGSGCIPVSLKLALPHAQVSACDVSAGALAVAQRNATTLQAGVNFIQLDFLSDAREQLPSFDIIVSNPPYIPDAYRASIDVHVKDHEPSLALFVPDSDPLLFYKAIADFGKTHLQLGGAVYCELHADHAQDTQQMFENCGYANTELRKDMHGNWRMLKAIC
jgi:release factor glutamine methyltransferase